MTSDKVLSSFSTAAAEIPKSVQESIDSTKVEYRQLGKSGLRVSVPILGALSFGNEQWQSWVIGEEEGRISTSILTICRGSLS